MQLLLIVALPFAGAVLAPLVGHAGRTAALLAALALPVIALGLLISHAPAILAGETAIARWPWIPDFGLAFALRLDGLSLLFAFLILAIGLLVLVYSAGYLGEDEPLGRFLGLMLAFMGSMLGIVMAENLILLVLFWELTSLTSFLLIAFHTDEAGARRSALMALAVTGAGGLALLGGVLLLGAASDSFAISEVRTAGARLAADPLAVPALVLVLIAAFTKSAQLPVHFWLPAAMIAPTPVSAYLHSAAMVKAGVYLLARLWPALSGVELWTPLVGGFGLATLIVAAWLALRQTDLKALLAYSTISHLGMMVMLLGFGSAYAAAVALFHLLNHALFKAPLFMLAGAIDHATGTRDLDRLGGLWRLMPWTSAAALVATASMAGLPPLNGYISKEMMLSAGVEHGPAGTDPWLPALLVLGALLSAAYAFALAWRAFLARPESELPEPHPPGILMLLPPALLVLACIAVGALPALLAGPPLDAAVAAVVPQGAPHLELALWHGFNLPFLLGVAALTGGLLVAALRRLVAAPAGWLPRAEMLFTGGYDRALFVTYASVQGLHARSLQSYLAVLLGAIVIAGTAAGVGVAPGGAELLPVTPLAALGWTVLVAGAAGTVWMHGRRITALVFVSLAGLMVSLAFAYLSAPDLTLTQVAVEIVGTVLLLLALRLLPSSQARSRPRLPYRLGQGALALAAGAGAGALAFVVMTRPREAIVAEDVLREATEAVGHNLVHLVLVDFRAFDTLGEISVLMIAALGVFSLVRGFLDWLGDHRPPAQMLQPELAWDPHPLQFGIAATLLMPFAYMVAIFVFLRGEAHPGGGFVAGLVIAMAVLMQYMAHGVAWTERRAAVNYRASAALGVVLAVLTGLLSLVRGEPFLTHAGIDLHLPLLGELHLTSVMLFDLGVLMTVAGATLLALVNIARIETGAPETG